MPMNGAPPPGSTTAPPLRPERVLAIAALAAILFLQPFLGIFDKGANETWAGVPVLFVYIFIAWALVVGLTAFVMEQRAEAEDDTSMELHADDATWSSPSDREKRNTDSLPDSASRLAARKPGKQ